MAGRSLGLRLSARDITPGYHGAFKMSKIQIGFSHWCDIPAAVAIERITTCGAGLNRVMPGLFVALRDIWRTKGATDCRGRDIGLDAPLYWGRQGRRFEGFRCI